MAQVDSLSVQEVLEMIDDAVGQRGADHPGTVTITGQDPVPASRHRCGELMAASPASLGMNLGRIWQERARRHPRPTGAATRSGCR